MPPFTYPGLKILNHSPFPLPPTLSSLLSIPNPLNSSFHILQILIQIVFLLVRPIIPQLLQPIQPPLLTLLPHFAGRRIHHIFFTHHHVTIGGGRRRHGGGVGEVEEVEDLVRLHGVEPGVLLVHDRGGDVDFETLQAGNVIVSKFVYE